MYQHLFHVGHGGVDYYVCSYHWLSLKWTEINTLLPLQTLKYLLTWPSFCISDQRSSTSVPHWAAACTHAWAYCPASELRRLREHPERDEENHPDVSKPGTWGDMDNHYPSGCTLFPSQAHEQVEEWWRSLCQLPPLLRPETWWSPSGSLSTPAPGHVVEGFYLHSSNRKVVYD